MKRSSRRTLLVTAALALLASPVAIGRLAGPPPTTPRAHPAAAPSVVKLDVPAPVDDVARTIEPVAGRILEHLWILHDGQILWVDPNTRRVTATVSGWRPRPDRPPVRLSALRAGGLVASVAGGGLLVVATRNRPGGRHPTRRHPSAGVGQRRPGDAALTGPRLGASGS